MYRFSSKEIHVNSGMYYYGYRFYDPNLQRWISPDPLGEQGGYNLYSFVDNTPSLEIDAFGLGELGPPFVKNPPKHHGVKKIGYWIWHHFKFWGSGHVNCGTGRVGGTGGGSIQTTAIPQGMKCDSFSWPWPERSICRPTMSGW